MNTTDQLFALTCAPLAVLPGSLATVLDRATALAARPASVEALQLSPFALSEPAAGYEVRDGGVAVLIVSGLIFSKPNALQSLIGGAAMSTVASAARAMRLDSRVKSALIDFDSPGGTLAGAPAAEREVRQLAASKPVVAVSTGRLVGPAYMVASAANAVFVSGTTDMTGGLAVTVTHRFNPQASGGITTEVTAGRYKRLASDTAPLTAEGAAYLRSQVDELYRVLVDTVARNRGTTPDDAMARMAEGRVFIGQQAIDAGLVDGIASADSLIARLAADPKQFAMRRSGQAPARGRTRAAVAPHAGSIVKAAAPISPRTPVRAALGVHVCTATRPALSPRYEQLRQAAELAALARQARSQALASGRNLSPVQAVALASASARKRPA